MSWYVDGTGEDISFSIGSNGQWSIAGHGPHRCRPSSGGTGYLSKESAVKEMSWRMYSSATEEGRVDVARSGVWKRFRENPNQSVASIGCNVLTNDVPTLFSQIMLSENMGIVFYDLCKTIIGRKEIRYRLLLEFFGLMPDGTEPTNVPQVVEFFNPDILKSRPYICESFDFILPDRELPH